MYQVGDVVTHPRYRGFVITAVLKGWYRGYFPSNVRNGNIEAATTSIRWHWVED